MKKKKLPYEPISWIIPLIFDGPRTLEDSHIVKGMHHETIS